MEVRTTLASRLHQPTAYTFLRRYLRQTGWTEGSFSLANYLVELAALYASQGVGVRSMPQWKAKLLRCAGVDVQKELAPCAAMMTRLHAAQRPRGKNMFVHQKFMSSRLASVAKLRANPAADAAFFERYMAADAA